MFQSRDKSPGYSTVPIQGVRRRQFQSRVKSLGSLTVLSWCLRASCFRAVSNHLVLLPLPVSPYSRQVSGPYRITWLSYSMPVSLASSLFQGRAEPPGSLTRRERKVARMLFQSRARSPGSLTRPITNSPLNEFQSRAKSPGTSTLRTEANGEKAFQSRVRSLGTLTDNERGDTSKKFQSRVESPGSLT